MSARAGFLLAGLALAAGLAACAGPYHPEIENRVLQRPDAGFTAADQRALEPYQNAPYFRDQP